MTKETTRLTCPAHGPSAAAPLDDDRPAPAEQVWAEAQRFFLHPELQAVPPARVDAIRNEILATGTYEHTVHELEVGARLAWGNHARCIGRVNLKSLHVLDFRNRRTPDEILAASMEHLRVSTNGGRLRAVVSIFAPQQPDGSRIRFVNPQLLRYAGYRQPDGSVVGDPLHADLTDLALRLGWRGAGTPFDLLPIIVDAPGEPLTWTPVPDGIALEVAIEHPQCPGIAELGLRWHANPAISNMNLEIGGLSYTAAPFSGWYLASEIGARNLSDESRYNLLPAVAEKLGLDTSSNRTMWKDRALTELTYAVLHSFRAANVRILDHHTAASQFMRYVELERTRGHEVPVDQAWLVPPLSSSSVPTFHAEFATPDPDVRPDFVYRPAINLTPLPAGRVARAQLPG